MGVCIPFTKKEDEYIRAHYLKIPIKTMGTILGRSGCGVKGRMKKMGLVVPEALAEQRRKDSRFSKGCKAYNKGKKQSEYMTPEAIAKTAKTRFKKGNVPHNTRPSGFVRITKDGYKEVRLKKGVFRLEHLHRWELENGPLPSGFCLRCVDGNKLNTHPDNWRLISRVENMLLNSRYDYPEEVVPVMVTMVELNKKIKYLENGKK